MPYSNNGIFRYRVPNYISALFSYGIIKELKYEVISTFKKNNRNNRMHLDYDKETYFSWWSFIEDSGGFTQSLRTVLKRNNLSDVLSYYEHLAWDESEHFNEAICLMLVEYGLIDIGKLDVG